MLDIYRSAVMALDPLNPLASNSEAQLTIGQWAPLRVVYAPFEHMPTTAKVVIVGITPGRYQAEQALKALHLALVAGKPDKEALRIAKLTASFSGPMRKNLVKMLDHIGLPAKLGLASSAELIDQRELAHLTSALRYPVFKSGENYNGAPDMLRTPCLRQMIDTYLIEEARALVGALWIPLGDKPAMALRHLTAKGILPAERVLSGLPHPSGANNGPIRRFMTAPTSDAYGLARETLRTKLATMSI
jgi:hypothetical protein